MKLSGKAASSGEVTAVARVITSLDKISSFGPGEILVTVATCPMWTPVIAAAGGVVTETGGA